ncbi:unnamed protein product [Medioppia subpectinata]|uniref:RDRP C-terminal head domain-containing protein n=1 Tax=Medioppia subpectinata TaxID=1979941 RepID=A0A7R9KKD4_9ACAR|nr:unnamed protein product [Medioppia subpectinata]CAG2103928.1 unnamed protein product [Medioppia subpectinata]
MVCSHFVYLRNERPKLYPDFMQKFSTKRTYLSKKMLGQLYRHCDRYSHGLDTGKDLEIKAEPIPCLIIDGWEKYKESALNAYEDYKRKVICLLNTFGVESEAKLLSGAFSKASKYMNGRTETNDVHELLENMINKLFIEFKERFKNECQTQETEENYDKFVAESERKLRASAWYMTPFKLEEDIKERYFGFSWTITEEVCKLMENNTTFNVNRVNHKCNDMGVQLLHDFFERNYLYREPVIDSSVTDESDRRQIIMEERFKTADVVLRAWLERQDHLFFKRKIGRKLISSTDAVLSDMDRKLRRELQSRKLDLLAEARDTTKPLKSAAELVMNFLTESVNEWLDIKTIDLNNRVVDTPLVKIGFSALITLNHFFKTREISHIIYLGKRFKISLKTPIREATFYIPLPRTETPKTGADFPYKTKMRERERKYVEYMVQYPEIFCERLNRMSGALEIVLEPYPLNKKQLEHFYLLTATGTMWSLQTIKSFICHPQFFQTVCNDDKLWKRKNLWPKGKDNKQNKENKQSN